MCARWSSFGVGVWLLLAPLLLGYGSVASILQGVAVGTLVCIATLVALDHPRARFGLAGVAAWIALDGHGSADPGVVVVSLGAGLLLFVLSLVPNAPRTSAGAGARA